MRRVRLLAISLLLSLAFAVRGAVTVQETVATTVTSAVPVTLTAGAVGSTTFNAAATSASTTATGLAQVAAEVLKIHRSSGSWDVTVRIDTAAGTGLTAGNSATINEVQGVTNNAQGTATRVTSTTMSIAGTPGSAVTLSGATDISIKVTSTHAVGATITLGMTILLVQAGQTNPSLSYSYTLLLN
ncbi:MAG: hypothetical protein V4510_11160 [bacterium]